ncbi:MAG TPA: aldose epimerase family protein [Mesorhizobium sp.]
MAKGQIFGTTGDGEDIHRVEIAAGGLRARIMEWGAVIQDLRLDGHEAPLVLGFDSFADYPEHSPHFGAVPGRFANRIANGRFTLDGERFDTDRNQEGKLTLHGGAHGFSKRAWKILEAGDDFVALGLRSLDGDMGFPGTLEARCEYRVRSNGALSIELTAQTDRPTLCNLTNHSYFNLDDGGAGNVLDHRLTIAAAAYLPNDDDALPTGIVQPVDGTPFDFRLARTIRSAGEQVLYDNNFCLAAGPTPLRQAAWAQGATTGIEMEMWTTEPGVQLYIGQKLKPAMPKGLEGIQYRPFSGFCLEAQLWPDAPNRPYFPQAVLRPGETYRHVTEYRFR